MITLKVDPTNPDMKAIRAAADAIRAGELVIFPTETVYGLAADALNKTAVKKVFDAKGRNIKEPLPVQVGSINDVTKAASFIPEKVRFLAEKYWPGPLTLVLVKNESLPDIVTAGKGTVGIRIPDHAIALALVKEVGSPIVATSANISGEPAPDNADDAISQVGESVSVVLDGGKSRYGKASTVVDVSTVPARILRRGTISEDDIKSMLGQVEVGV